MHCGGDRRTVLVSMGSQVKTCVEAKPFLHRLGQTDLADTQHILHGNYKLPSYLSSKSTIKPYCLHPDLYQRTYKHSTRSTCMKQHVGLPREELVTVISKLLQASKRPEYLGRGRPPQTHKHMMVYEYKRNFQHILSLYQQSCAASKKGEKEAKTEDTLNHGSTT